jgi:DNA-directed DNA polymerase III PolC
MQVQLHTHSYFSFLEGVPSPEELVQAAIEQGLQALALTDRRCLTGAVEFYDACTQSGIKPILGLDIDIALPGYLSSLSPAAGSGRLTLLAEKDSGWPSLCRLSSLLQSDPAGNSNAPLNMEDLVNCSSGLVCLAGGTDGISTNLVLAGDQITALKWLTGLSEIFPSCLYIKLELNTFGENTSLYKLARLARQAGIPCAASHNIYHITESQAGQARLLAAIQTNKTLAQVTPADLPPPEAHFLNSAEMERRFFHHPQALLTTVEIAERCNLKLPLGQVKFPKIDLPENLTPIEVLASRAETGACAIYGQITPEISQRLNHEIGVIDELGFAPLFLIMDQVIDFARRSGIPTSSRGSASSSLVAHCLGITDPDPIRLNLYFERFLNPARQTPPDIDTDICSKRRDEVIRFVYERFGAERVAMVSTVNRFRPRSALRETAKAHGLSQSEIRKLADQLPYRWYRSSENSREEDGPYTELYSSFTSDRHRKIFKDAQDIIGIPRHLSIHPGGVVITPGRLEEITPTQVASKGVLISQFDLQSVKRLGLVKIDLLGIRGLSVLGEVANALLEREQNQKRSALELLDSIPEDDPETAATVERALTIGCFQIESPGMRATLREVQARSVDDLMVALALYRPGPLTGGLKDHFVRRHKGIDPPSYIHPSLKPLLNETYGVILYQEQVLRIAHELAGFSLSEADLLRRAMSHFDPGKKMVTLRNKFLERAHERFNVPAESAAQIWELMAAFAGYGFPKAHAASYAQVAWRSAWCKTHFPGLFMAAVLANWGGYYRQSVYLTEARRLGLQIRPPLVNNARSEFTFQVINGVDCLVMGLNQVRDLARRTESRIREMRPFDSLSDFLTRVDPRPIEANHLIMVGALEDLGGIPQMLAQVENQSWTKGQLPLFQSLPSIKDEWTLAQKASAQEKILGASVSVHPLELYKARIAREDCLTTVEAAARISQQVRIAGMRQTWRRFGGPGGEYTYYMSLEDLEGIIDVVLPGDLHRRYRSELSGPGPYIIEGIVELDIERGEPFIKAHRIWNIADRA